jgi:NitT/TauT family transport system substrate-binding protein
MYRPVGRGEPRRRRAVTLAAVGVLAVVLLAACGGSSSSGSSGSSGAAAQGSGSGGTTTVTVGVIPILDVAPIYLGVRQGFFTAHGLDLKLQTAQGGAAIVPAVLSGQYQFGFSNTVSLLLAASKRLPVKVVTAGNASTGKVGADFGAVVVKAGSPIRTAADLVGKKVAVNTLKNINTTTIDKAVRDAGGDPTKVDYVELPFPDMVAAVAKGDVDAAQVVEPFLTIAKNAGDREVASNYAATAATLQVGLYFTASSYAQQHADLVTKFDAAMKESLAYADSHPDDARAIVSTYTKIDPAVQKAMVLPRWPADIDRASVQLLGDLALQDKLITQKVDVSTLLP